MKNDTRQLVLEFIRTFHKENGMPPTIREIAEGTGLRSTSTVHYHLENLAKDGHITLGDGKNRAIKLLEITAHTCPKCGHVA